MATDNFIVATSGVNSSSIGYSYDGVRWLLAPSSTPSQTFGFVKIACNGQMWVAVKSNTSSNSVCYSYDGINWAASSTGSALLNSIGNDVVWCGNLWIAVGQPAGGPTNGIIYSYDGVNWKRSANNTLTGYAVGTNGYMHVVYTTSNTMLYSFDGITWYNNPSSPGVGFIAIEWNGTMWLAGGNTSGSKIMYSYDGLTWTASSSGSSLVGTGGNGVKGLAWNGFRWVAVFEAGTTTNRIIWSTDGINWSASTSGDALLASGASNVTWNGSVFIAVGQGTSGVITSSDGNTWTASTSGNSVLGTNCISICSRTPLPLTYINRQVTSKFCVGTLGTAPITFLYSYDGIEWYRSPSTPFASGNIKSIVWNGLMWVACANYVTSAYPVHATLAYSFDGIIWTASSSGTALLNLHVFEVAWGGNIWVAVGHSSPTTNSLIYSYDGINWTRSDTAYAIEQSLDTVAWNGSMWLAARGKLMSSYDGINWTMILSTFPTANGYINKLATNGKTWLWAGPGNSPTTPDSIIGYSSDGYTWSPSPSARNLLPVSAYPAGVQDFSWNGSRWVATAYSGANSVIYSSDGITWTASTNGTSQVSVGNSITWNGSIFIIGGQGTSSCPISTDGNFWSSGSLINIASVLPPGVYSNQSFFIKSRNLLPYTTTSINNTIDVINRQVSSKFCVAGQNSTFAYSYEGVVWYKSPSVSISGTICGIAFNGVMWVAIAVNGNDTSSMAYSYNGINWSLSASGSALLIWSCKNVAWGGNVWVAVGARGLIYSYDGVNWTLSTSAATIATAYTAVAWNGTMWLASTNTNRLAYSSDGVTWAIAVADTVSEVLAIATNGRMWVWVRLDTNISYSYNGFNWTSSANSITGATYAFSILWNGTAWLITSQSLSNPIMYSTNGINWSSVTSKFSNWNYTRGILWNGSFWIVGGDGNNAGCAISLDGVNWATCRAVETIFPTGNIYLASRNVLPINPVTPAAISYFPSTSITWASTVPRTLTAGIDTLAVNVSSININVSSITANVSSIRITRYLYGSGTTSSGTLNITFSTAFASAPNVTATISGSTAGFINVSSITTTGFTVNTYNISGTLTNYPFNWHAVL